MAIKRIETEAGGVRWRLRFYLGRDPDGKRNIYTKTFERKKDAEAEERRLGRQKDMGALVRPSKEPLADYLVAWLDNVKVGRVRARTLHDYRGMVRRYLQEPPEGAPPVGKIPLNRLRPEAIEALYSYLWTDRDLSPRTIQYLHAVLRQGLSYAVKTGALARNPTDHVKPPTRAREGQAAPGKAMRAMSKEEAAKFLEAAREDRYRALWAVLLTGGLRPGEALGLLWQDVDLEGGKLHVRRALTRRGIEGWKLVEPKTARGRRVVVLPGVTADALRAHRRVQAEERLQAGAEYEAHEGGGFVFATPFGAPLDGANVNRRHFRRVMAAAELGTWEGEGKRKRFRPAFRMYDLRHTCATLLLLAGENPKIVSERLGHASIALTLDTYSHVLPSMQEEAAAKLEAMFGGAEA